ncbi:hypothetical protein ACJX0J_013718 [Zea mays]
MFSFRICLYVLVSQETEHIINIEEAAVQHSPRLFHSLVTGKHWVLDIDIFTQGAKKKKPGGMQGFTSCIWFNYSALTCMYDLAAMKQKTVFSWYDNSEDVQEIDQHLENPAIDTIEN